MVLAREGLLHLRPRWDRDQKRGEGKGLMREKKGVEKRKKKTLNYGGS